MITIPPAFFKNLFEKHNQNYDHDKTTIYFIEGGFRYALEMKRRFNHDNKHHHHNPLDHRGLPRYANTVWITFDLAGAFKIRLYFATSHPPVVRTDGGPEIDSTKLLGEETYLYAETTMEDVEHLLMLAALSEDTTFDYIP